MIYRVDDVVLGGEQAVSFDFFQGLRHRFLAERTTNFLEGEEFGGCFILDEVDVGETTLMNWSSVQATVSS